MLSQDTRGIRLHRDYRRPGFLSFLTDTQYEYLFAHHYAEGKSYDFLKHPFQHVKGPGVFIPTFEWFQDFCNTQMAKFKAVLRLHWFLCCPEEHRNILSLQGAGKQLSHKFDMATKMSDSYRSDRAALKQTQVSVANKTVVLDIDDEMEEEPQEGQSTPAKLTELQQSQAIFDEERDAADDYRKYLQKLLYHIHDVQRSEKEFDEVCILW